MAPKRRNIPRQVVNDQELCSIARAEGLGEFVTRTGGFRLVKFLVYATRGGEASSVLKQRVFDKNPECETDEAAEYIESQPPYVPKGADEPDGSQSRIEAPGDDEEEDASSALNRGGRNLIPPGGSGTGGRGAGTSDANRPETEAEKVAREAEAERVRLVQEKAAADRQARINRDRIDPDYTEFDPKNYVVRKDKRPKMTLESIYATGYDTQEYDENYRPIPPAAWSKNYITETQEYNEEQELPDEFLTEDLFEAVDLLMNVNGKPCYNAEAIALGSLKEKEFFLMPKTGEPDICPVGNILRGRKAFKTSLNTQAQIYMLAKTQAADLGVAENMRVRWAVLRVQAYVAGWYSGQKGTRFMDPPKNSLKDYLKDTKHLGAAVDIAYALAGFIPFFHEMTFRAQAATWTPANAPTFEKKAEQLARSAGLAGILDYMDKSLIFGAAFRWIGVERVKDVLLADEGQGTVPYVFELRQKSAPSGKAFICNIRAVIRAIKRSGWWDYVKREMGYTDEAVLTVAERILENPFRYHMMCGAYGFNKVPIDEQRLLDKAKDEAELCAPVCHAYTQVFMQGKNLANNKTIERHAAGAGHVYTMWENFFKFVKQHRGKHISEVTAKKFFAPLLIEAAPQQSTGGGQGAQARPGAGRRRLFDMMN